MGVTLLSVFNAALSEVSEKAITNIETAALINPKVRDMRDRWEGVTVAACEVYPFDFAQINEQLNRLEGTPLGFDYAYAVPAGFLRKVNYTYDGDKYNPVDDVTLQNGTLCTNSDVLYACFISRPRAVRPELWPQIYADYIAFKLAAIISPSTLDESRVNRIRAGMKDTWDQLTVFDAQQGPKLQRTGESSWNASRRLGGHRLRRDY